MESFGRVMILAGVLLVGLGLPLTLSASLPLERLPLVYVALVLVSYVGH